MSTRFLIPLTLVLVLSAGCRSSESAAPLDAAPVATSDNSMTSVDWPGVYKGTLPCADCPGLATTVILGQDMTFRIEMVYLERNVKPFVQEGHFTWLQDGLRIVCVDGKGGRQFFDVGENRLFQLDADGQRINGELADRFALAKVSATDAPLQGTYWKLKVLRGKPVAVSDRQREAHLVLERSGGKVHGSGGCNRFFGSYAIRPGNRIQFSRIGSTMMACPEMESEREFFRVLESADNFTVKGDALQLNRARMAPLAEFQAVP